MRVVAPQLTGVPWRRPRSTDHRLAPATSADGVGYRGPEWKIITGRICGNTAICTCVGPSPRVISSRSQVPLRGCGPADTGHRLTAIAGKTSRGRPIGRCRLDLGGGVGFDTGMRDPLEGLGADGTIRTGADRGRVPTALSR